MATDNNSLHNTIIARDLLQSPLGEVMQNSIRVLITLVCVWFQGSRTSKVGEETFYRPDMILKTLKTLRKLKFEQGDSPN